jgi:hypothetical protein
MATVPSFRTWVTGEIVTAAELNSNVRDAGNFWLSVPVAELRQTVAQSIANGSVVAITFDAEDVDTDGAHSTVTNTSRFTGQTAGRYRFSGGAAFAANATGYRQTFWRLNSATVNGSGALVPAITGVSSEVAARTMTFTLNGTTDFVELGVIQTSGGALNTAVVGADQPTMSVRWVGTT